MSNDTSEHQFLTVQIQANNYVLGVLEQDITQLLAIVREKKNISQQLQENNRELNIRIDALQSENDWIVKYSN